MLQDFTIPKINLEKKIKVGKQENSWLTLKGSALASNAFLLEKIGEIAFSNKHFGT